MKMENVNVSKNELFVDLLYLIDPTKCNYALIHALFILQNVLSTVLCATMKQNAMIVHRVTS